MLNINLSSINTLSEALLEEINNYEEKTLSCTQEIFNTQPNWHDQNSERFFENIPLQKLEIQSFIDDLKNINETYKNIIKEIQKVNIDEPINKLFVNQNNKATIIESYKIAINNFKNTMQKLNSFNLSFCSSTEKSLIKSEISRLNTIITKLTISKNKIEKAFDELKIAEENINTMLSKDLISALLKELHYSDILFKGVE